MLERREIRGSNSVVESQPSKLPVAGSIPVSRSKCFAYALRSGRDGWLYVGLTSNLQRPIKEHNPGDNRSTPSRGPFELIYVEACETRQAAREREKFLKSGRRREMLRLRKASAGVDSL